MVRIQGSTSSCVSLAPQRGYAKLLMEDIDLKIRHEIRDRLQEKRDCFLNAVRKHPSLSSLSLLTPQGSFFVFPDVTALYGKQQPDGEVIGQSDIDVTNYLLSVAHVVTVPGSRLGRDGHIRFAYASRTLQQIEEGVQSISEAISQLN